MKTRALVPTVLLAAIFAVPAFAQSTTAENTPQSKPAETTAAQPAVAPAALQTEPAPEVAPAPPVPAALPPNTVPGMTFVWDCGECDHNDKVPPLILEAYTAEAKKKGYAVSQTESIEARITDIRQRPPGVRVMFGIMAGKDRLEIKFKHNGQEYTAGDTSANAIQGLNSLSETVGERAFKALITPPKKK